MAGFNLGDVFVTIKAVTEDFENGLKTAKEKLGGLNDFFGAAVDGSKKFALGLGIVGGALAVAGHFAVQSASDFQQNRIAFETMLGSADKAQKLLKQVSDFAAQTPFELPQVVEGSKKLLAFGVSGDQVISTFTTLGNVAAGVGTDKLPGLINVFGQVKAAGKLMSQDLLQFTSAGVPVIDLLAEHFKKPKEAIKDMVESGQVKFEDLKASLEILGGPSGRWGDLMAKQSQTFSGTISNISDQFGRFARSIVGIDETGNIRQGSIFAVLTDVATQFLNWLNANGPMIQTTVLNIISIVTQNAPIIIAVILGALLPAFVSLGVGIWTAMAPLIPFMALGAALVLGFQALKANGIDPVKIAVDLFKMAWDFLKPSVMSLWDTIQNNLLPTLVALWNYVAPTLIPVLKFLAEVVGVYLIVSIRSAINILNVIITIISTTIGVVVALAQWFDNLTAGVSRSFGKFIGIINGALGGVYNAITAPFKSAFDWLWGKVDQVVQKLKDLNPFMRHSPSLVEQVTKGTLAIRDRYKVMFDELSDLAANGSVATFAPSLVPASAGVGSMATSVISASQIASNGSGVNITVDLTNTNIVGTVPRDVAEAIGDQVIKKLQQSVRI